MPNLTTIYGFDTPSLVKPDWEPATSTVANPINGNHNTRKARLNTRHHSRIDPYPAYTRSIVTKMFWGDPACSFKPKGGSSAYKRWLDWKGWGNQHVNRLRFFVKLPNPCQLWYDDPGSSGVQFATYTKHSQEAEKEQESEAGHWYHYYPNLAFDQWVMYMVDPRPAHQRNQEASDNSDAGLDSAVIPYPEVDPDQNYFDAMTTHYIKNVHTAVIQEDGQPQFMFVSDLEGYRDDSGEDVSYAHNPCGVYDSVTSQFRLGWTNKADDGIPENQKDFEVAWSYTSCHGQAWADLTPGATWTRLNGRKYVAWDSGPGVIDVSGRDFVYFAIRAKAQPVNAFRQIVVPVNGGLPPV